VVGLRLESPNRVGYPFGEEKDKPSFEGSTSYVNCCPEFLCAGDRQDNLFASDAFTHAIPEVRGKIQGPKGIPNTLTRQGLAYVRLSLRQRK